MKLFRSFVLGMTFLSSVMAYGETTRLVRRAEKNRITQVSQAKPIAQIDIRPSYGGQKGEFHTEDSVEFGFRFSEGFSLSYLQAFLTNIYNPNPAPGQEGLNARFDVGYVRGSVKLWENKAQGLSLGYQGRLYLPIDKLSKDSHQIVALRNYFTLTQKVSDTFSIEFSEIPIFFAHSDDGYVSPDGAAFANPMFENRFYVNPTFTLAPKWSLSVPLMFHQTKYRTFRTGAENNSGWSYFVWTYPELTYQVQEKSSVGLAFYSDNLIKPDLSGISFSEGMRKGVVQLSFATSF